MSQPDSIRDKWLKQIAVLREEIAAMPDGASRENAVRRVRQLENAAQLENWISPANKIEK